MTTFLERNRSRARYLWARAKSERASPRQIGFSVAIGAMACFAPVLWFHLATALLLASIFRVNRLWAATASQLPSLFGLLRPFILFLELQIGHVVRTGAWLDLNPREAFHDAPNLLVDWGIGAAVVGVVLGAALGLAAYAWARRRDARGERERGASEDQTKPRTPDESPRPSSESPP